MKWQNVSTRGPLSTVNILRVVVSDWLTLLAVDKGAQAEMSCHFSEQKLQVGIYMHPSNAPLPYHSSMLLQGTYTCTHGSK